MLEFLVLGCAQGLDEAERYGRSFERDVPFGATGGNRASVLLSWSTRSRSIWNGADGRSGEGEAKS